MKILVVDDNEFFATTVQMVLEREGMEVAYAKDGIEGYAAYLLFKPDLVITDIQMPGRNGLEMMEDIRNHDPLIKTIYMSGNLHTFWPSLQYEQYLETNLGKILGKKSASDDRKAGIFSKVSTNVIKGAFETTYGLGTMGAEAIQRTEQLIENSLIFIIKEAKSLQALAKMIGHDYQTYEHATKVLWFTVAFLQRFSRKGET